MNINGLEERSQAHYLTEVPEKPAISRITGSIQTRGLIRTAGICALAGLCKVSGDRLGNAVMARIRRWEGARFDRRYCVRTAEVVSIKTLNTLGPHARVGSAYTAVRPAVLREIFSRLSIDHENFSFVDYGSGMGRVLLWASGYPFHEIVGVEFSPELHAIAEKNIQDYRNPARRCSSIRSECLSAEDFILPDRDLVLFFANPFGEPVMRLVLDNLRRSLASHPRRVWILYYRPKCGFLMDAAPFLHPVFESCTTNYHWYSIYSNSPMVRHKKDGRSL